MFEESTSASEKRRGVGDDPTPVGLKFGSVRTVVARPEDDAVQTTVALTCSATYQDPLTGKRRAVYGERAANEYPDRAQFMLQSELAEDNERATVTRSFLETFAQTNDIPPNSAVVYAIPSFDDRRTTLDAIIEESISGRLLDGYSTAMCESIPVFGSDLDAFDRIFTTIKMGSTNLEACVYRRGEQLAPFSTGSVRGCEVDRWIINNVEEGTQGRVHIDRTTAREYKEGRTNCDDIQPLFDDTTGSGAAQKSTVERSVTDAIDRYVKEAVDEIANEFLPRLVSRSIKIYKRVLVEPIVLTGDMAVVPGLREAFEDRLSSELQRNIVVTTPAEPITAAARGAQRIAGRLLETGAY
ncbi:hypothetical protein [Halocatena pleomorpha]|uniref:Rod shape-determining protein MreB n=1 Tax=Halocatena pleomorpha TaxID=1785090 RepID=A0A3P3RAU0_9EURY|nr:hypothetical protein [Halocatena pleomorpha]RRJ30514.1 hypothetical protein EIK79_09515 [Halocatena pleomorpha]